jgi:hypothetical protein
MDDRTEVAFAKGSRICVECDYDGSDASLRDLTHCSPEAKPWFNHRHISLVPTDARNDYVGASGERFLNGGSCMGHIQLIESTRKGK